jgi:spermidine synthase
LKLSRSPVLKLALFATGLSGIVAEYILSTLATYFIGDSATQWSLIVSVMLFSMGLGSRFSKYFEKNLLVSFIAIEFTLSILVSFSSLFAYTAAGYTEYVGFIIYGLSILIGILIGLEIPLVIRLNEEFQSLRINVASVMEKDYLGSLVGGLFFAFIGLPILGLTYTPFILGLVNFVVAILLFFVVKDAIKTRAKSLITLAGVLVLSIISIGAYYAKPLILEGEQARYKDKVVLAKQSKYQRIVLTQWKDEYWLYINGNQQLSTIDEDKYHEPLIHPALNIIKERKHILVLGGGDGCAVREILKYPDVEKITLVDLDSVMTNLGKFNPILRDLNQDAFHHPKLQIINTDAFNFLESGEEYYDAIIVDLPDPRSIELNRLYTLQFYQLCKLKLKKHGVLITQAGSPYYATKAFLCIDKTMAAAGFTTQKMHNQVITLGEWGWVMGVKSWPEDKDLKSTLEQMSFDIPTSWLNQDAMLMMCNFGKNIYEPIEDSIAINQVQNPVLYRYYLKGNWDLY